jgi:hypothetical protein
LADRFNPKSNERHDRVGVTVMTLVTAYGVNEPAGLGLCKPERFMAEACRDTVIGKVGKSKRFKTHSTIFESAISRGLPA